MGFPRKDIVDGVKKQYPAGTRVELTCMNDFQAPPLGTKGTVIGVDDTGSILVNWDNGSHLNVVYGEDSCKKLKTVTTICYGKRNVWDSREEALDFFLKGMLMSEGSEQQRYTKIYTELQAGNDLCSDE